MPARYEEVRNETLEEMGLTGDEELKVTMSLGMQRYLNMVGGCRPSDAMYSECRDLKRLGRDAYIAHVNEVGTNLRRLGY